MKPFTKIYKQSTFASLRLCVRSISSSNLKRCFAGFLTVFLVLIFAADSFAQVKREHLYKLRDRNRFEGVRMKNWKPVSGEVKLASLVFVENTAQTAQSESDSISIHFYSTIPSDLEPSVFNLEHQYFMIPRVKTFGKDWNKFTWPSKILTDIKLPLSDLNGIVEGQKGKVYFPVCFEKPSGVSKNSALKATLVPDKDMTVNIALYSASSGKSLKTWEAQALKSDAPFDLEIPGSLFASEQSLILKIAEKGGREYSYRIELFGG